MAVRSALGGLAVAAAAFVGACGGSADDEARDLRTKSTTAKVLPIEAATVSREAVAKAPIGSVTRAFLRYWSDLQFQAWPAAAETFEPGLRRFIGEALLIRALANQGTLYRTSRPQIVSATTTGPRADIRYYRIGGGPKVAASMSWTRNAAGQWLIIYEPTLDQSLAEVRQLETQQIINPLSQKADPAAVRAGSRARQIQSLYLQRRARNASSP